MLAVYYGAKILILMQFTTGTPIVITSGCCLLWCKDTNFNAIHNILACTSATACAVYYGAKILILMQFTTREHASSAIICCLLWCKDTNFNAIHNSSGLLSSTPKAVYYSAKILILMQFTTRRPCLQQDVTLFIMVQRY